MRTSSCTVVFKKIKKTLNTDAFEKFVSFCWIQLKKTKKHLLSPSENLKTRNSDYVSISLEQHLLVNMLSFTFNYGIYVCVFCIILCMELYVWTGKAANKSIKLYESESLKKWNLKPSLTQIIRKLGTSLLRFSLLNIE